ncbi:glycosyltransferase family 4 protein [Arthrobacter sp. JUb115]|uniref:glycosyltransferase family 4 protein n=1 Tax=Arthrobacter sp. JUb115 TaxID=2485108 RepID=UPI0010621D55|nr:glycosyltransferase family 4 protein [Arthrobacter sp. JUb115]TDU22331.1 glycosyltransferase involved in cell wall biosynthesis [Arthrobacter sp. JUb115]
MTARSILVTVFAKAAWGGLHENVLDESISLLRAGFRVTVACSESRLAKRLRLIGCRVVGIDWDYPEESFVRVMNSGPYSIVHAHPFLSRELGIRVAKASEIPIFVTMHGNYLDYANSWGDQVDHIVCVSEAHRDQLLSKVPGLPPWNVSVISNGISDDKFDSRLVPLQEKLQAGEVEIVVASRLDGDKGPIIETVLDVVNEVGVNMPALQTKVTVVGEGAASAKFRDQFASSGVDVDFLGWRVSERIGPLLRQAALSIAPGRAAAQSLAVGTPTVAVGSQGLAGLQTGVNLQKGWWSNFGGYPVSAKLIGNEVTRILTDPDRYARTQVEGREFMRSRARQSLVDSKFLSTVSAILK